MATIDEAFADIAAQLKALGADDTSTQAALATLQASMTDADDRIAKLEQGVPPVDLSGYALKTDIPAAPDLSGYALKSDIPASSDLSAYALKTDIPAAPDLSGYALKSDIPAAANLSQYALKSDLQGVLHSADLSDFVHHSDLAAYATTDSLASLAAKADVDAVGARVGIIEAGVMSLDVGAFDRAANGTPGKVVVVPVSLPVQPVAGTPYNVTLTGTGGAAPYTFAIEAGSLPDGLSLAAGGAITGTPSRPDPNMAAPWSVTISATDANGVVGTQDYAGQI